MAQRLGTIARNLALKSSDDLVERVGARALPELPPCIWGKRLREKGARRRWDDGRLRANGERTIHDYSGRVSATTRAGIREIASFVVPPRPKIERTRTHLGPVALDT